LVWGSFFVAGKYKNSVAVWKKNKLDFLQHFKFLGGQLTQLKIRPHICKNLKELCLECQVRVPSDAIPKLTWVAISDKVSAIERAVSHPFAFFEQDDFDAVQSCFNRTTTPPDNGMSNNPPFQVGTPSHHKGPCKASCRFITEDAWVDFIFCAPKDGSKLKRDLLKAGKINSGTVERYKRNTIYIEKSDRHLKARFCENEDLDIAAQLWVALRISLGQKW